MARTQATVEEIRTTEEPVLPAESTDRQESSEQPEQKPSSIGFFEQISRFSTADWEQHIVYVYRLSPITDRMAGGTTKYLMKYGSRFDQDTVKADHGSGRYRLQLNRSGDKGQSKTIRTYELDIEDINFPPKVPPGEWLDDPRNKRWAWARKKEDAAAANAGTGESWTPERVLKLVRDLRPDVPQNDQMSITKAVLDAVKETRAELGAANNPASMITTLKELILIAKPAESEKHASIDPLDMLTKAKALFGDNNNSKTDAVVVLLTEQLKASREDAAAARESAEKERQRNHELQLKMMETKANAADPMDMIEKVLNIKERLGGDEPDQRNWKEKLVDQGMQYVPQLLDVAGKIAGGYRRQPEPQQAQQRTQQQQPAAPASTQTQAVQTPAQPQPAAPAGEPMPPEPIEPVDPEIAFLLPIFERFGARLVAAFRDDPNSGGEVAGAVRTPLLAGRADYERICRMGREKILATIELIPQMKTDCLAAGTPAMLNDFIDDFIAGPDDEDDEELEEPEPTDPIGPDAKRKKKVSV